MIARKILSPGLLSQTIFVLAVAVLLLYPEQAASYELLITDIGRDIILRADSDGSNLRTVRTTNDNPVDAIIQDNKLYWTENLTPAIWTANQDGSDATTVWNGPAHSYQTAESFAIDPNTERIYWTDDLRDIILSANLDGTDMQTVIDVGPANPCDIALDIQAGKIYWTESSGINIQRANLDGSEIELLVNTTGQVGTFLGISLDLVNEKMYWTHRHGHAIQRSNLDGSMVETIVTDRNTPRGITVDPDSGFIFWVEAGGSNSVIRANLDGTDLQTIVSGLSDPWSVEIIAQPIPEPSTSCLIICGAFILSGIYCRRQRCH